MHNPLFGELKDNADTVWWARKEVRYLADLSCDGVFVSFLDLQRVHQLNHKDFYRYATLRHAIFSRFTSLQLALRVGPLECLLRDTT